MSILPTLKSVAVARLIVIFTLVGLAAFVLFYGLTGARGSGKITSAECEGDIICVYLNTDHASPDVVTVRVGEYVKFSSADGKTHNMGLGQGDAHHDGSHKHMRGYVSGDIKSDEAWKVQFKKTGTYELHDHYRPHIRVTVIAYEPNRTYTIN